jgi:uncharacterized protein (TIGR03437 family)
MLLEPHASSVQDVFMRILVVLSFIFSFGLEAQIVSTDDGVLHFFSTLIPAGSGLPAATRLYRYSPAGIEVEATLQLDPEVDLLGNLDSSSDGNVLSYWSLRHPLGPNPFCSGSCYYPIQYTGKVRTGGNLQTFDRAVSLSPDGRFAVLFDSGAPPMRIDLTTGERVSAPYGLLASQRQAITSDGSLLLWLSQNDGSIRLFLWSPSGQRDVAMVRLLPSDPTIPAPGAIVSANGATVVWVSMSDKTVRAIDVLTGADVVIANTPGPVTQVTIDAAGDLISFVASDGVQPRQLYVARTDGSEPRVLAGAPEGVNGATLQSDGKFAYALTASNRMLRIDTGSMDAAELWPPTPSAYVLGASTLRLAPGSYQRITGGSLNSDVRIGEVPLQVLSASPQELHVQVPFDAPETTGFLRFKSDSPLEEVFPAEIHSASPRFLSFWDAGILPNLSLYTVVVHGDYSGFVNQASPAHLGEVVNFYMTGLGAVTPAVPTGAVSPSDPPAVVTAGVHVTALRQEIPIVFAGLAPAMTGVYLLSIRLPESLDTTLLLQPLAQPLTTLLISVQEDGAKDPALAIFWIDLQ